MRVCSSLYVCARVSIYVYVYTCPCVCVFVRVYGCLRACEDECVILVRECVHVRA